MTERTKQEQAVVANLADAGCDKEQIEQFMDFLKSGRKEAGLSLLAKHRRFLLDCYHADQKKIDCLDYLIYNESSRFRMDRVKRTVSCAPRSVSASGQKRQQVRQISGISPKGSHDVPVQGPSPSHARSRGSSRRSV